MPSVSRIVVPFAAGVAVGVVLHKYWPQIREAAGPGLARGSRLFDRVRTRFWEQGEKFADLVAEIREEEELARKGAGAEPSATAP
jgi:hypothetical protein